MSDTNQKNIKIMKTFETFEEALSYQREKGHYEVNSELATGIENIDRVQFALGNVFWAVMADGYYLDDYDEHVTQYGFTASGEWAAVSGGHCSCYGWEDMEESDITYYPSLEVLLKADPGAQVIINHRDVLKGVLPFLDI
jgi:hypothetical protein